MASSQSLYTCRSWTRPIVKSEILTWWYRTYQLVGNPWTSPLASWPHWHLPSLQTPPCADGPENRQRQRVRIWDEAQNKTGNLWLAQFHFQSWAVPALSDRDKCNALCDGRQLPKSPPLNTSQSLWKETVQRSGDHVFETDESSGRGQLCMGLHSCSLQTQADCQPCKAGQDQRNFVFSRT